MPIAWVSKQIVGYEGTKAAYCFGDGLELGNWERL